MSMHPTSIASRCLAVLQEGPATTAEIALEVGISSHSAGTHMRNLWERKKVAKGEFAQGKAPFRGKKPVCLWSLPPQQEALNA